MTLHLQAQAYLDFVAANSRLSKQPTIQERRADSANYLTLAGLLAEDVSIEHTYVTTPTADVHAVIFCLKNVRPHPYYGR